MTIPTGFGLQCRIHRMRRGLSMKGQAWALGCSSGYISLIELGMRSIPDDYVTKLMTWLELNEEEGKQLIRLAAVEKKVIRIVPKDKERALLASEFAAAINKLPQETIAELQALLKTDASKTETQ